MSAKAKTILKCIIIFIIIFVALNANTWWLQYRQRQMYKMLEEHGVVDSNGEKLPPYSGN